MKNRKEKAFTIVELVIVIAVIAILAAVLIPTFSSIIANSRQSAALQTARNSLTSAVQMTSTAWLPGKDDDGNYRTVLVVGEYAFGYDQGELSVIDYPTGAAELKLGTNFDTVFLSNQNISNGNLKEETAELITLVSDFSGTLYGSQLGEKSYFTDGANVCSYFLNSDLAEQVIVFTTLGGDLSGEQISAIIENSGLNGYTEAASGKGNSVDFGDLH